MYKFLRSLFSILSSVFRQNTNEIIYTEFQEGTLIVFNGPSTQEKQGVLGESVNRLEENVYYVSENYLEVSNAISNTNLVLTEDSNKHFAIGMVTIVIIMFAVCICNWWYQGSSLGTNLDRVRDLSEISRCALEEGKKWKDTFEEL